MFLNYIDELYSNACKDFFIPQNPKVSFRWFISVKPCNCDTEKSFLISKQDKSKLFILDGKQRVYLSDIQIVKTILEMNVEDKKWFIDQFVKIYKGNFELFSFEIESKVFNGKGMCKYPGKKTKKLFSDSDVEINDIIFLINFIVYKDLCWGEEIETPDFYKRTLSKYISLVDYYSLNDARSKPFLESIGYPLEYSTPIDRLGKKSIFNSIETFDIKAYE